MGSGAVRSIWTIYSRVQLRRYLLNRLVSSQPLRNRSSQKCVASESAPTEAQLPYDRACNAPRGDIARLQMNVRFLRHPNEVHRKSAASPCQLCGFGRCLARPRRERQWLRRQDWRANTLPRCVVRHGADTCVTVSSVFGVALLVGSRAGAPFTNGVALSAGHGAVTL